MYEVKDNFLPKEVFLELQDYCNSNNFNIITAGDKQFSVLEVPETIKPYLEKEGYRVILSFIRSAWNDFDNDIRIHCDWDIMNQRTALASVLYINDPKGVSENGTAFYSHHIHGNSLSDNAKEEEYNRLILEDSNNESKWEQTDYVKSKPNRLLSYKSSLFHSKFPKQIKNGIRIVCVVFYKKL